jgi:hypothetical protein
MDRRARQDFAARAAESSVVLDDATMNRSRPKFYGSLGVHCPPGVVSLAQSFGLLAHWHPHLHLVVTDGAFRRDGGFVTQRSHDAAMLAEA